MARAPNTAAREYLSPSEQSLLEEYGITSTEFDRVRQDPEHSNGSEMVKDDKPTLELKPPKEMAQDVDRETFDRRWADELQSARQELPEQDNAQDVDREYSR